MSSYCYLEHNGQRYQTYVADDFQDYHVGDLVPWEPEFNSPGEHVDGIYECWPDPPHDPQLCSWLVVRAGRIVEHVTDRQPTREEFGITAPWRDYWPPQAWEQQEWQQERIRLEEEQYWREWQTQHGREPTPKDKAAWHVGDYTRAKMREQGMYRLLFGKYKNREELAEKIREPIRQEFSGPWSFSQRMLEAAAAYRGRRILTEAGLWDAPVEAPMFVSVHQREQGLEINVRQYDGMMKVEDIPAGQTGEQPAKIMD